MKKLDLNRKEKSNKRKSKVLKIMDLNRIEKSNKRNSKVLKIMWPRSTVLHVDNCAINMNFFFISLATAKHLINIFTAIQKSINWYKFESEILSAIKKVLGDAIADR